MQGNEELVFNKDAIFIKNSIEHNTGVMHIGERDLMHKLADIVTTNGGHILEIGFGMHLSADRIQSNQKVTSHTIIEIHKDIYINALEWAKDKPNVLVVSVRKRLASNHYDSFAHLTSEGQQIVAQSLAKALFCIPKQKFVNRIQQ